MDIFIDPRFDDLYERHPLVLADVGARGGLKQNWQAAQRHLRVLGFEPDKREYDRLQAQPPADAPTTFFNVALHDRAGRISLNIARDAGLTSIFEPDRAFLDTFPDAARFDTVARVEIDADTLDHVVETNGVAGPDFIKADTQGSELFVLQGARRALETAVLGVEVEAEFTPIYRNQPVFADVDVFLRGLGFSLFDLRPCYWKRAAGRAVGGPYGQIIWGDALYLKGLPALGDAIGSLDAETRKSKVLKMMSIALLYGYADYALEVARAMSASLTPDEVATVEQSLLAHATPSSDFPGRRQIASGFRQLWRRTRVRDDAWSVSDADLGNLE
jgi:FkbM family methyltransferase